MTTELTGFCFATPDTTAEILSVVEDDFCLYLLEHCIIEGKTIVAMDIDTKNSIPYGIRDLIHAGITVVIVDPTYSPIHDKQVLPLHVHRDISTLWQHYRGAVCVGRLLVQQILDNRQDSLRKLVACYKHCSEAPVLNTLDLGSLGWRGSISPEGVLFAELTPYEARQ